MINRLRREYAAFLSWTGRSDAWPPSGTWFEELFWTWHNVRVWWSNIFHPLSEEQKRANMEDLMQGAPADRSLRE